MSWKHVTLLGLITLGLLSSMLICRLKLEDTCSLWCCIITSLVFVGFVVWVCYLITHEQKVKLDQIRFEGKERMELEFEQKQAWEKMLAEQRTSRNTEQTIKDEVERQLNEKLKELKPSEEELKKAILLSLTTSQSLSDADFEKRVEQIEKLYTVIKQNKF